MNEPRTGPLVAALARGVDEDLSEIAGDLEAVRSKLATLGESAKAINGLGVDCAGWADRLSTMATEINKEREEIPGKLIGKRKAEIKTHTNPELAQAVKAARGEAA